MEGYPGPSPEADLPNPEKSVDKDDDKSKKKERAALLTKRSFERERRREEEPKAKKAGEQLLTVVKEIDGEQPAGSEKPTNEQKEEKRGEAVADETQEAAALELGKEETVDLVADEPVTVEQPGTAEQPVAHAPAAEKPPVAPIEAGESDEPEQEDDVVVPTPPPVPPAPPAQPPGRVPPNPGNVPPTPGNVPPPPGNVPPPPGGPPGGNQPPQGPNNPNWNLPLGGPPGGPLGPNFNHAPVANPNVQPVNHNQITEDDLHNAEKRGVKRGVLAGGLTAWLLTRRSQGKKREALAKELNHEIGKRDKRIDTLEAAAQQASKEKPATIIKEVPVPQAEAPEPAIGRIFPVEARIHPIGQRAPLGAEVQPGPTRLGEVAPSVKPESSAVAEAADAKKAEVASEVTPEGAVSPEAKAKAPILGEKVVEQANVAVQEAEKSFREDAIEKLDRAQDQGGLAGGGAAAGPAAGQAERTGSGKGSGHPIGPAMPHDPVARSLTQARQSHQQAAKRASRKAITEITFATVAALAILGWLFLHFWR